MRTQDISLLIVFDAIMTEKSITRAANHLSMTQPAVSNAVSRMRVAWKDDVFVKDGRNIQPTMFARNLWDQIKEPLTHLSDAVDPKGFDPATSKRTFRISVTDIAADTAWAELRKVIELEAPGINIHAIPNTIVNTEQLLEDAEVDLVIGMNNSLSDAFHSDYLFTPKFLCVMRHEHPLAKKEIPLQEFAHADHLLVSLSGDISSYTDKALLEHGLSRRIAMTVNHFSSITKLIKNSNLICVTPLSAVSDAIVNNQIAATLPPVEIIPEAISLIWHKRQDNDAGLAWLRKHLRKIITKSVEESITAVKLKLCKENSDICSKNEK